MTTFYFNTGVRPETLTNPRFKGPVKGQVVKDGTLQIPFDCDAPADAALLFLCDTPDLLESKCPGVIVREVSNTTMCSKFAYMRVTDEKFRL